jgi:hypothetical protein
MNPMLKVVLWGGLSAVAALLVRRKRQQRAAALDVGTVSDEWLAHRRGVNDAL